MDLFEIATRKGYTFESGVGQITIYDLWRLPLKAKNNIDLDTCAKLVNKRLKELSEESFVETTANSANVVELTNKLDIIKHVISVLLEEQQTAKNAAEKKLKKEALLAALKTKQDQKLTEMSIEQLMAEIEKL